jgi:hypothetical protein
VCRSRVTIPYGRKSLRRTTICHRSRDLELAEPVVIDGIPTTGLARTLLDVAAVEPTRARSVMWAAMRTHDLGWDAILRTLVNHSRRGRPGLQVLRALVAEHYGVVAGDSATEDRAYQILVDSRRVPIPQRLVPIVCADGVAVTAAAARASHTRSGVTGRSM